MEAALSTCSTDDAVQGGEAVMAQWWDPHRDFDVMCPGHGRRSQMRQYFTRF